MNEKKKKTFNNGATHTNTHSRAYDHSFMPCILTDNRHSVNAQHWHVLRCSLLFLAEMKWNEFPLPCIILSQSYAMSLIHIGLDVHTKEKNPVSVNGSIKSHHIHHLQWEQIRVAWVWFLDSIHGSDFYRCLDCIWIADFFHSHKPQTRDLFIRIILFHMLDKSFRWLTDGQLFLAIAHPIDLDLDCELVIVR